MNYIQSEAVLENSMIQTLLDLGYERISIPDEDTLKRNFKNQISLHNLNKHLNNTPLTDSEFERLMISLGGRQVMSNYRCDTLFIHEDKVSALKHRQLDDTSLAKLSSLFKVLGDPTRMNILFVLEQDELCVCDLTVVLNMTQSAVSHQLKTLKDYDLVRSRREGKVIFYRLADAHVHAIFKQALEHIREPHDSNV